MLESDSWMYAMYMDYEERKTELVSVAIPACAQSNMRRRPQQSCNMHQANILFMAGNNDCYLQRHKLKQLLQSCCTWGQSTQHTSILCSCPQCHQISHMGESGPMTCATRPHQTNITCVCDRSFCVSRYTHLDTHDTATHMVPNMISNVIPSVTHTYQTY